MILYPHALFLSPVSILFLLLAADDGHSLFFTNNDEDLASAAESSSSSSSSFSNRENHNNYNNIKNKNNPFFLYDELDVIESSSSFTTATIIQMSFEEWVSIYKTPNKSNNTTIAKQQQQQQQQETDVGNGNSNSSDADQYENEDERQQRKRVYENNVEHWNQLNRIPGGAKYGPESEPYADLTPEEFLDKHIRGNSCSTTAPPTNTTASSSTDRTNKEQQIKQHRKDDDNLLLAATTARYQKRNRKRRRLNGIDDSNNHNDNNDDEPITIMYVDWRKKNGRSYVTPVKRQGRFGTCWSFSAAENLEGLAVRQGYPLVNISEQEFISCCDSCRGHSTSVTFDWLVNNTKNAPFHLHGHPALEQSYPYQGNSSVPCRAQEAPRAPVQLHSWTRVQDDDGTGDAISHALHHFGPMGMGVDASCFHGYQSGIVRSCPHSQGVNHAVLMVAAGTDLYLNHTTVPTTSTATATATVTTPPPNDGNVILKQQRKQHDSLSLSVDDDPSTIIIPTVVDFFTIKNSWGKRWGEQGYVRIERGKTWWGPINVIYTE